MTSAASVATQRATLDATPAAATATPTSPSSSTPAPTATATTTATRMAPAQPAQLPATSVPVINLPGGAPNDVCSAVPNDGSVNVRQGPALNQPVVALLQTHAQVIGTNNGWYQISYPNSTGWVSGTVVRLQGECSAYGQMPQPEVYCHFYPFGANGSNIDLLTQPNGTFLTYAPASSDFIATAQSGQWVQVLYGATGQQGWILKERGQLSGNCASLENVVFNTPDCRITATVNTASALQPYPDSPFFGAFTASASVQATARTSDGWYGFDPGVNWVPPDVTGTDRLRWLPAGNPLGAGLTTTAGCEQLPVVSIAKSPTQCTLDMPNGATYYTVPGGTAEGTLPAQTSVLILARTFEGWMGFDPGTAPPGNYGLSRLRWLPDSSGGYPSSCMGLPLIQYP